MATNQGNGYGTQSNPEPPYSLLVDPLIRPRPHKLAHSSSLLLHSCQCICLYDPVIISRPVSSSLTFLPPQDAYRVQDLEDTISSLKRVLKEREKEVDELKSHQRSLQAELHQVKNTEAHFDKGQVRISYIFFLLTFYYNRYWLSSSHQHGN